MLLLLKNLLFTVVAPGTVAVYLPLLIASDGTRAGGLWLALAAALGVGGGGIYAWCVWDFATFGRGTPLPLDAPKKLVIRGLYRFTRNPMYVGVLAVVLAWAALFRDPHLLVYTTCVAPAFHLFVVLYEERHLSLLFGVDYDAYRGRVGRWLPRPARGLTLRS